MWLSHSLLGLFIHQLHYYYYYFISFSVILFCCIWTWKWKASPQLISLKHFSHFHIKCQPSWWPEWTWKGFLFFCHSFRALPRLCALSPLTSPSFSSSSPTSPSAPHLPPHPSTATLPNQGGDGAGPIFTMFIESAFQM